MSKAEERRWVRTLKAVNRWRENHAVAAQVAALARELDRALPKQPTRATAGGDPVKLRGIPSEGFGGAMRSTRPDRLDYD